MSFFPQFTPPTTRRGSYETSYAAAMDAKFFASAHRRLAINALSIKPMTDYELAAFTRLQQNSIGKRRKDCQDAGLVEVFKDENGNNVKRPAPSGSKALVWTLTVLGYQFAEELRKTDCINGAVFTRSLDPVGGNVP
jgi:hypothetical protein